MNERLGKNRLDLTDISVWNNENAGQIAARFNVRHTPEFDQALLDFRQVKLPMVTITNLLEPAFHNHLAHYSGLEKIPAIAPEVISQQSSHTADKRQQKPGCFGLLLGKR